MRGVRIALSAFVCLFLLMTGVHAASDQALQGYEAYLPDEAYTYVEGDTVDALERGEYGTQSLLRRVASFATESFSEAFHSFTLLLGGLLLFCALRALQRKEGLDNGFSEYVSMLAFVLPTADLLLSLWEDTLSCMEALHRLVTAMTPATTALLLLGGNTQGAAVQGSMFVFALGAMETVLHTVLTPLFSVLLGVSILGGITVDASFLRIVTLLRKGFSWLLTFFFGFLALILGYQSTIAAGADTLGARTVKFTVGSTVPLVGGALAESVRTLAGSIAVLRATVGTVGILCVVAILLQPLLLLWAHQLFFGVLGAVGGLLNCPKQGEFFVRMQELLKFAWSLMLACGLFFLFLFSVFARSAVAYGG